ncbi:MAG TPA: hypothetical protein VN736_29115 [Candidatus Limnocylindrales bacterium]|nr:hypothetical protein [Candidatus Limnocylindrales bacterium]
MKSIRARLEALEGQLLQGDDAKLLDMITAATANPDDPTARATLARAVVTNFGCEGLRNLAEVFLDGPVAAHSSAAGGLDEDV